MEEAEEDDQPRPMYKWGLPTPLTPTFHNLPTRQPDKYSPMFGTKRTLERFDSDDDYDMDDGPRAIQSFDDGCELRIVRRHRHRLYTASRRIAATEPKPKPAFNIFKAIVRHPNLFFEFTKRLSLPSLVDLYAIDKEFHWRFNQYSVSIIHDYVRYHAPDACDVFSWSLYSKLCISDPSLKPMNNRLHLARDVPSLRWAKLVLHREQVVKEILTLLALEGHRLPRAATRVVMKFWTLMEIKTQATRSAFVNSRELWTDADLFLFHLFLVKLDMRFSHPVQGQGVNALSHLLLTQPSLNTLRDVLSGALKLDYDLLAQFVLRTYPLEDLDVDTHPWLDDVLENGGVDEWEFGKWGKDGWDDTGAHLDSGVDLLRLEGIKRGLQLHAHFLDFVMYGYVDEKTGRNIPAPMMWRGNGRLVMPERGWPSKEDRAVQLEQWEGRFGDANSEENRLEEEKTKKREEAKKKEEEEKRQKEKENTQGPFSSINYELIENLMGNVTMGGMEGN